MVGFPVELRVGFLFLRASFVSPRFLCATVGVVEFAFPVFHFFILLIYGSAFVNTAPEFTVWLIGSSFSVLLSFPFFTVFCSLVSTSDLAFLCAVARVA